MEYLDAHSLTNSSGSNPHTPSPPLMTDMGYELALADPSSEASLSYPPHLGSHHTQHFMAHYSHDPTGQHKYAYPEHIQAANPAVLHGHPHSHSHHHDEQPFSVLPPPAEYDHDPVKLEHASPMVVPSQMSHFYRPSSSSSAISNGSAPPPYIQPLSSIPIMHTDDAASKETQYLRRKCFNCQTTEPPSWRRSTLNPGKIVCNKCGLYERTHNKPRPHQFGLRPGNKARKQVKTHMSPSTSPKARHGIVGPKKDALDYPHPVRRGSINGSAEWDDGSANGYHTSAYPSLGMQPAHPHHHHPYAMPPPHNHHGHGAIRLPQAPPIKTAGSSTSSPPSSMISSSAPGTPYGSLPPSAAVPALYGNQLRPSDYFHRRGSVGAGAPVHDMGGIGPHRRHTVSAPGHQMQTVPELWAPPPLPQQQQQGQPQTLTLSEMSVTPAPALSGIESADSTPRKALAHGTITPPPIGAAGSARGSPNPAAAAVTA